MAAYTNGEQIRERLKKLNLSITEAASNMGMSRQNLNKHLQAEPLSPHFVRQFKETFDSETKVSNQIQPIIPQYRGVPLYNVDISAGGIEAFDNTPELVAGRIIIPGFEKCDAAFPVYGHSMYPTYESGCIVLCKEIKEIDIIMYGEVYMLVTSEQRMLKRIVKADSPEDVQLLSDNDEFRKDGNRKYEPFDIPRKKIKKLYLVKGMIKRNQL
jgi:phage repressor protein C with HTH and peptisase S24 domain